MKLYWALYEVSISLCCGYNIHGRNAFLCTHKTAVVPQFIHCILHSAFYPCLLILHFHTSAFYNCLTCCLSVIAQHYCTSGSKMYLIYCTVDIINDNSSLATRLGFKTCSSKTKTKTKTKTQQFQDQDQDQDSDVQDQDRDSRLTRPILEVHGWDGLWQTKRLKKSWQAENPAYR